MTFSCSGSLHRCSSHLRNPATLLRIVVADSENEADKAPLFAASRCSQHEVIAKEAERPLQVFAKPVGIFAVDELTTRLAFSDLDTNALQRPGARAARATGL